MVTRAPLPLFATSEAARVVTEPRSVRLSLTDRCDLACVYCRPESKEAYFESKLNLAEWKLMIDGLLAAGVVRVRITGGEPLLSPHLRDAIAYLADCGVADIALTTNATRLAKLARPLKAAGLHRLNISIDSLDDARFARMTRGGKLEQVLAGIDAAVAEGFAPIKLNAVVMRDENLCELSELVQFAWARNITPRFLEVMAIGEGPSVMSSFVSMQEMKLSLQTLIDTDADARVDPDRGPARYLPARGNPKQRVGFISGTSDTYCKGCDRLRIASDGMVRPCLATSDGLSASAALASGDPNQVASAIAEAWKQKPDGDSFKGCTEASAQDVSIRQIGG
jgi:GTP 3',8-cyclase